MYEHLDRRYALALYEVALEKNKVEEYLGWLKEICNYIDTNEEFNLLLKHPGISSYRKKEVFTKLFKGRVDNELVSFLLLLIDKDRILYLREKLFQMEKIHLERQNKVEVLVKSTIALTDTQREALKTKLEDKYNKIVILNEVIDKEILGGIYVRISDDVIDGTLKHRVDDLKTSILMRRDIEE